MTKRARTTASLLALSAMIAVVSIGCGSLGDVLGDAIPADTPRSINGEITAVNTTTREIILDSEMASSLRGSSGTLVTIAYTGDTTVTYENVEYEPEDLEAGDLVEVFLTEDSRAYLAGSNSRGDGLVADHIEVTTSVQDRS